MSQVWPAGPPSRPARKPPARTARKTALTVAGRLPPDWDSLLGAGSATARARWFSLVGNRLPGPLRFFCFTGQRQGPLVLSGTVLEGPPGNRRIDPHAIFSGAAVSDGLLAAGPHPWHGRPAADVFPCALIMLPNYECFPLGPGADQPDVLSDAVSTLCEWCIDHRVRSIAFLYLSPAAGVLPAVLEGAGFGMYPLTSRYELSVTWDSFAGYLDVLPSKRRVAIRRELRELASQGVVIRERGLDECPGRLVQMRCALMAKYGGRPDREREQAMLGRLRSLFPAADVTVVTAEVGDVPVGFTLMLRDGGNWTAFMTGADYANGHSRLAYFATTYYRPAELAPGAGIRKIGYGPGSWEAKRLRGCRDIPLWAAARRLG